MKLEAETLFYMACCDAFRDDTCELEENQVLNRLRKAIGLSKEDAVRLARQARGGERPGVESAKPLDPQALFTSACQVAWVDSLLEVGETRLLVALAEALGIAYEDSSRILEETRPADA